MNLLPIWGKHYISLFGAFNYTVTIQRTPLLKLVVPLKIVKIPKLDLVIQMEHLEMYASSPPSRPGFPRLDAKVLWLVD